MGEQRGGPTLIQSVQRALRLLEAAAEREGRGHAKELARAAGLSLPTAYHLLRTLTYEGYLQRRGDGGYVLGERLEVLARHGAAARSAARARTALEWLRDELTTAVYLARYVDGEITIVEIMDGPGTPRLDLWVGIHDAAHATALGKCILAQLPATAREGYLAEHPLHELTPRTTVDKRRLCDQLPGSASFATDDGEYALGIRCLASPVPTPGEPGALAIVHPRRTLTVPPRTREALRRSAARVALALIVTP
jgi:IclR family acetate operon transcriptional repressor